MMAMMSPSWTTSPSLTRSSETVPAASAITGISIFIDSRMTRVSPSSTLSPWETTTFHTLATISARTSVATRAPLDACRSFRRATILGAGRVRVGSAAWPPAVAVRTPCAHAVLHRDNLEVLVQLDRHEAAVLAGHVRLVRRTVGVGLQPEDGPTGYRGESCGLRLRG